MNFAEMNAEQLEARRDELREQMDSQEKRDALSTDELEARATATGINHRTLCRWQDEGWTLCPALLC